MSICRPHYWAMHMTPCSTLHMTPRSTLYMMPHSTLYMMPHSTLHMMPRSTLHMTPHSTIHMKPHWAMHIQYEVPWGYVYEIPLGFAYVGNASVGLSCILHIYVTNFILYIEPLLLLLFLFTVSKYYSQLSCLITGYIYNF